MNRLAARRFTQSASLLNGKSPRFVTTLKEASKPALEKSRPITKPIGLDSPILLNHKIGDTYSLTNIKEELFSSEAKERRQKKLDYEIKHSPFYETKSFRNTNGKIFTPPISFFKKDKAKYFPDFISTTLDGQQRSLYEILTGKVSIVRLYSTVSGEQCSHTYFKEEGKDFAGGDYTEFQSKYPKGQIIDINIPQNWMKGFFLGLSKSSIKKTIAPERHGKYFILPDHIFQYDVREKLYCDNMCSGYIYLLDHNGKIRWATSGYSNEEESALMWKCVKGLEKELNALST
ncbi:ATPase assembly factor ATP10 [Scheffersomyces xylosifermentans]|uniref:ATPase assembly factor ATP10 n=1 Tax=Scheffersomyces xylosifermentans TaxID=1304137 RepID=UPI00315C5CEC